MYGHVLVAGGLLSFVSERLSFPTVLLHSYTNQYSFSFRGVAVKYLLCSHRHFRNFLFLLTLYLVNQCPARIIAFQYTDRLLFGERGGGLVQLLDMLCCWIGLYISCELVLE